MEMCAHARCALARSHRKPARMRAAHLRAQTAHLQRTYGAATELLENHFLVAVAVMACITYT